MWAFRRSERPPPLPRATPTTFGRPGAGLVEVDVETGLAEPGGDERGDLRLADAVRHEIGIGRLDRDESTRQLRQVVRDVYAPSAAYTIS